MNSANAGLGPSLYITLVASLPPIEWLEGGAPLLSELAVRQRLSMLSPHERILLQGISGVLLAMDRSVTVTPQALADWLALLQSWPDLQNFKRFADQLLRLRTVAASCRARLAGEPPARLGEHPVALEIERQWQRTHFGLGARWPEVPTLCELIQNGDGHALFDWWYGHLWSLAKPAAHEPLFTLESVAFYLVRWQLASDFRRANETGGRRRLLQGVEKIVDSDVVKAALEQEQLRPVEWTGELTRS